jgi:hypothetical protein
LPLNSGWPGLWPERLGSLVTIHLKFKCRKRCEQVRGSSSKDLRFVS